MIKLSSIFTIELPQVDYAFINGFCALQLSEGERIEYKREFPAKLNLEKTICAMANTWGGVILVGVEANTTTNKPTGVPGIELIRGLEEKIVSMCLSNISPPIVPEVKVCEIPQEGSPLNKAVVFVRVSVSHQSPHEIIRTHETLVRTHNRNTPADLKTIERLFRRRDELLEMISDMPMCNYKFLQTEGAQYESIVIRPNLSIEPIVFFSKQTDDWLSETLGNVMSFNERKPSPNQLELLDLRADGKIRRYCSVNSSGRVTFQQPIEMNSDSIVIYSSMAFLVKALRVAKRFYNHFGYFGEIAVGFTICTMKNLRLGFPQRRPLRDEYICECTQIYVERTLALDDLDNLEQIAAGIFRELCRWFHLVLEEKIISEIVSEILS